MLYVDPLIQKLIGTLKAQYGDNIIAIYGIGSYFDSTLPSDWRKNDLDVLVIVEDLEPVPKKEWTDVRFETLELDAHKVWVGFNTLEAYESKEKFAAHSFTNYQWSLLELKNPHNSRQLYGINIRAQLPEVIDLEFDYDDIFARALYHFDKSIQKERRQKLAESKRAFTKGVFKLGFYLSILHNKTFSRTSIKQIDRKIHQLMKKGKVDRKIYEMLAECIKYRRVKPAFSENFARDRNQFLVLLFTLLAKGEFHRRMRYAELTQYLATTFSGLKHLRKLLETLKSRFNSLD